MPKYAFLPDETLVLSLEEEQAEAFHRFRREHRVVGKRRARKEDTNHPDYEVYIQVMYIISLAIRKLGSKSKQLKLGYSLFKIRS